MTVNITEIRVRYCECDPMGVVHHTVYPVWFEMGRTELLRMTGVSYRELEEAGVLLAVVRLEARYRQPARYDEVLQLETSLATVGRVKVEHTYRLLRGEELLVTGATTLACLDKTGQARLLPDLLLAPQSDPG
jgi:acyl-CoA thioester hydrolase